MGSGRRGPGQRCAPVPELCVPCRSRATRPRQICTHAGAAAGVAPIPAPELRPGVAGWRRGRGSPGVAVWIKAHARAGAAAALEQEEGEGGSGARGSCDALGGARGSAEERCGVGAAGAEMPRWGNERVQK